MKRIGRVLFSIVLAVVIAIPAGCNIAGNDNNEGMADRNKGNQVGTRGAGSGADILGQHGMHQHNRGMNQSNQQMNQNNQRMNQGNQGMGMRQAGGVQGLGAGSGAGAGTGNDAAIPITNRDGKSYVSLRDLVQILQFKSEWDPDTKMFRIGDNDVVYEIKTNSREAIKEGKSVSLDTPSILINGDGYIPIDGIDKVFGDAMNYELAGKELRIKGNTDDPNDATGLPDFKDDPNDPFGNASNAGGDKVSLGNDLPASAAADVDAVALKNIDINAMINTAKKYIGVPYDFGAKPYAQSKRFDCSTYTQYVFGKYGVKLPRLSRSQGKVGTAVSRTNLRKGDLLFFYLPGRYKSNKIIGHVGIYMGGGKMIHSSNQPKDGVQITSINKSFWKKTYLSARRVAY